MAKRIIYKHELKPTGSTKIQAHKDSLMMAIQEQDGKLVIWIEHPEVFKIEDKVELEFVTQITGIEFDRTDLVYLSTVQLGAFVAHVYRKL